VNQDTNAMPTPPLACQLTTAELRARVDEWAALAARALVDRVQMTGGVHLRFRRQPGVEAELRRLVELERACCPFLAFSVESATDELLLSVRGPAWAANHDRDGWSALIASMAAPVRLHEHTTLTPRSKP
jgi:hypothetical protein